MAIRHGKWDRTMKLDPNFWKTKRVLVTGHTGFKGSWLSYWLQQLGADVIGFSLKPNSNPSLFDALELEKIIDHKIGDIRHSEKLQNFICEIKPDVVFHLAAQPIVSIGYDDPSGTFNTNVMGVVNLLESFRGSSTPIPILIVSSDKCYLNYDTGKAFNTNDPLGGHDPYSASKAGTEIVVGAYKASFFDRTGGPRITSARAGNVIGGGDWSKDRLVPDAVQAFQKGVALEIRNPFATRPWQHVIEPIYGYLILIQNLDRSQKFAKPWNFGPNPENTINVEEVCKKLARYWQNDAKFEFSGHKQAWREAKVLALDVSETSKELQFESVLGPDDTFQWTVDWYRSYYENKNVSNVRRLCDAQIFEYTSRQKSKIINA